MLPTPCRQPEFSSFCRDPSILGKIANLFHCFDRVSMYHDYYHTEPVAPCLTTATGQPAVDFLIRWVERAASWGPRHVKDSRKAPAGACGLA